MRRMVWLVGILSGVAAVGLLSSCGSDLATGAGTGSDGGTTAPAQYLAVADTGNNRVLIYNAPFTTDESASVVLGQTDLAVAPVRAGALDPWGLTTDASGNLYVADLGNCRVLQYRPPFTTDMSASVVFGQKNISSATATDCMVSDLIAPGQPSSLAASGMDSPVSVASDSHGNLWVVDQSAGRITEYVPPFSTGMAATVAIGQTSIDSTEQCNGAGETDTPNQSPTANTLCEPEGIAFDAEGDLWVADWGNIRILEYVPPFSTGMAASLEIGQPATAAFTSNTTAASTSNNCNYLSAIWLSASCVAPTSLAFDSRGALWAVDQAHNRVIGFSPPFSNGMAATIEIGQPGFTQANNINPPAANTVDFDDSLHSFYGGLSFDQSGNMFVSDSGNSRVLLFNPPFTSAMDATKVIGQPNMTIGTPTLAAHGCSPPSATTLCYPEGVLIF